MAEFTVGSTLEPAFLTMDADAGDIKLLIAQSLRDDAATWHPVGSP
jgi:hypothetical protein